LEKSFENALVKRHNIVHRSGHAKDTTPVEVGVDDIESLRRAVQDFADELAHRLAQAHSEGKR